MSDLDFDDNDLPVYEGDEDGDLSDVAEYAPPPPPVEEAPAADALPVEKTPTARWRCAGFRVRDEAGRQACTYQGPTRWRGACPKCGWYFGCVGISAYDRGKGPTLMTLGAASLAKIPKPIRIPTGLKELDHVLGGGVVLGKVVLLKAPPGCGKTTLLLQAVTSFARGKLKALFASGEMAVDAAAEYAGRLGTLNDRVALIGNPEGISIEDMCDAAKQHGARLIILDSIQVATVLGVKSDIGQPTMVTAAINYLSSYAQRRKCAVIVIGHVTSSDDFAGGKKLQHLVDVLLQLSKHHDDQGAETNIRTLTIAGKSRQSATDLYAYLEMTESGLITPSFRTLSKYDLARVKLAI